MMTYEVRIDHEGTWRWYKPNTDDLHREDGPAIVWADGGKQWWINGQLHRTDGPAVEYADGTNEWLIDGKRHRADGPAVEYASGTKVWYRNGKKHRIDGPAVEYADGRKEWYLNGKYLTEEAFNNRNRPLIGEKVKIKGKDYGLA